MNRSINYTLFVSLLVLSGLLFSSQQSEKSLIIQQMMEEAIHAKVHKYKLARAKRCRELILAEASRRADSIVIKMAKDLRIIQDTINRPIAPDRPNRPEVLKPIDSTAAAPLLPDTFKID